MTSSAVQGGVWPGDVMPGNGLHAYVAAAARHVPDAVAVRTDMAVLTYRELDARVTRLAHRLRACGVGRGVLAALHLERGADVVTALLAVHQAGGAYLPLDPQYPAPRLAQMVADSHPHMVVTAGSLPAGLAELPIIELDSRGAATAGLPETHLAPTAAPDDLAWVIYTSGSTGRPKGVAVPHRGIPLLAAALADRAPLRPGDTVLGFFSPSFDASVWEMLMAFRAGATFRPLPPAGLPPDFGAFLAAERITAMTITPSAIAVINERHDLPGLRVLCVCGEACPPALVRRWAPGRAFRNVYGPTEVTVATLEHRIRTADADLAGVPIGRPLDGVTAHVLDEQLRPVAAGDRGELYLGGPMLARGYLGRPGITASRFVADPFTAGGRLYRTGDRCWSEPDGALGYGGRLDRQVKVRGFRIELGDVEALLRRMPGVADAVAVVAGEPGAADVRLVGYVVAPAERVARMRAELVGQVPEHMVPTQLIAMDSLPVNPVGKVDRDALPVPAAPAQAEPPPATPMERVLARMWQHVLGVAVVGRNDNFFAMGGQSLHAAKLRGLLADEFGCAVPVRDIYRIPGLAEQAVLVDALRRGAR